MILFNAEKGRFRLSLPEFPSWGIMLNLTDLFTSIWGTAGLLGKGAGAHCLLSAGGGET